MPRIIVTTDPSPFSADAFVWLDEHVHSVHLSTDHAAAQLIERLAWAISDAEDAEGDAQHASADRGRRPRRQARGARTTARGRRERRAGTQLAGGRAAVGSAAPGQDLGRG